MHPKFFPKIENIYYLKIKEWREHKNILFFCISVGYIFTYFMLRNDLIYIKKWAGMTEYFLLNISYFILFFLHLFFSSRMSKKERGFLFYHSILGLSLAPTIYTFFWLIFRAQLSITSLFIPIFFN